MTDLTELHRTTALQEIAIYLKLVAKNTERIAKALEKAPDLEARLAHIEGGAYSE